MAKAWFITLNEERREYFTKVGIPVEDLKYWVAKWHALVCHCEQTNKECSLSFYDYVNLALAANIYDYSRIGKSATSMQLGRIGDTGGYTLDNCRFITKRQNMDERCSNGGTKRGRDKIRGALSKIRKCIRAVNEESNEERVFMSGIEAAKYIGTGTPQVSTAKCRGYKCKGWRIFEITEEEYQQAIAA